MSEYRAWDKKLKRMIYSDEEAQRKIYELVGKGEIGEDDNLYDADEFYPYFDILAPYYFRKVVENNKDRIVVMQYTGVKNTDSDEFCEGDILQDEEGYIVGVIEYDSSEGAYHCDGNSLYDCKDFNIVGDKYNNKELLDG